ncbi:uncharacterized protein [Halyomorpha halys]|uniref:uncharacterized protein n=1 Tax=Halyomorpha halys TaxID=286706 RepID=UPI0006D51E60|nr:uncharacterized protein LOC106677384 [Halyomorpha halys]
MENQEDVENRIMKFKSLEAKKKALEVKLNERCYELKKLCIAEAELTGIIPFEIPLDPDESPPKIRRRVGTMFPFTDDTINQLKLGEVSTLPVNLLGKSPKRKNASPWKSSSDPLHSDQVASCSPTRLSTWPQKRSSPTKQPSQRTHPYKAKLNLLKKW